MVDAKSGCAMPPKAIRRKNDAMDVFHSFLQTTIPNLPKPTDHARTITLRTDDAKELTSKSARAKCAKIGVTLTNSAGHHKNGIAKVDRFMRTLEGGIRAMIDDAEAPHNEWPAAAARCGEIHNDTPTKGNQGKSPSQVFYAMEAHQRTHPNGNHSTARYSSRRKERRSENHGDWRTYLYLDAIWEPHQAEEDT